MLVNLYKSKTPLAVFSLPILICAICLPIFFINKPIELTVFSWQHKFIELIYSAKIFHYFLVVFVLYISALEMNRVVNVFGFYTKNTYLPGVIYVLAVASFDQVWFSMSLLAYGVLIHGIGFLFRIDRQGSAIKNIFIASFLFGIATVFEPFLVPIVILPWFALLIFRSFVWREWFALIVGICIPWIYHYAIYYFVTGNYSLPIENNVVLNWKIDLSNPKIGLISFLVLLAIYSIWKYLVIIKNQLLVLKKRSIVLFHFLWLMLISFGWSWFFYNQWLNAIIIPFSILVAVQILNNKHALISNIMLTIWIGLIVWNFLL